jgi:hypothetical protein
MARQQAERILDGSAMEPEDPIHLSIMDEETIEYIRQRERRIRGTQALEMAEEISILAAEVDAVIAQKEDSGEETSPIYIA